MKVSVQNICQLHTVLPKIHKALKLSKYKNICTYTYIHIYNFAIKAEEIQWIQKSKTKRGLICSISLVLLIYELSVGT